jgi:hypothetical protein
LISAVALRAEALLEIEFCAPRAAGRDNFTAIFRHKSAVEFFAYAEPGEDAHARGQERFANVKAWKFFALQNNNAPSSSRQQSRRRTSGRTAANDRYIIEFVIHAVIKLAKLAQKQVPAARIPTLVTCAESN